MKRILLLIVLFFTIQLVTAQDQVFRYQGKIYTLKEVDVIPDYVKGMNAFYDFLAKNYVVPDEEGIKGEIIVTFVVELDGTITDIKVLRDLGFGTGKEAIRVLKIADKWIPGKLDAEPVRVLNVFTMLIK